MSLSSILTKLSNVRGALVAAIGSKGVTLASSATLHDCASAVLTISQGSGGTIPSIGSSSYTPTTSDQVIRSGVFLDGDQTILGDAALVGSNIVSGVSIFGVSGTAQAGMDVTLGYINTSSAFQAVSFSGTDASDSGSPVNLPCYVWNMPGNPQIVNLYSGETLVSSAVSMTDVTVSQGYRMEVKGGMAQRCSVLTGAFINVTSGGKIDSTLASDTNAYYTTSLCVINLSSGTATNTMLTTYGTMMVLSGGTATSTTANSAGSLNVQPGGTAISTTVNSSGTISVTGGIAINTIVNSGRMNTYGTAINTLISGGILGVSGGSMNSTTVRAGGHMSIKGGTATNITVFSGYLYVSSGGTAHSAAVNIGGNMYIQPGGSASNVTVNSGGSLRVSSGGTALYVTSNTGAVVTPEEGAVITYYEV